MRLPLWILAAAVAGLAYACTFTVEEGQLAVVTRFGDPRRIAEPGLGLKWPAPIDQVVPIDMRMQVLDPDAAEYLTADKKNVMVDAFMAWSVAEPRKFLVSVRDQATAESRLAETLRSVVGDVLVTYPFAALVSHEPQERTLTDVARDLTTKAQDKAREAFGVDIHAVRLKRINFPVQNKESVFRRMEAERESIANGYRSEGAENYEKMKADADRQAAELAAEADRKVREIRGGAEAEAARIYAEAYGKDRSLYEFLRSLETVEKILGPTSTVVIPSDHEVLGVLQGKGRDG